MEMNRRVLLTAEHGFTQVSEFDICCDECGDICRELVELLSPAERANLISRFKATRRTQLRSGELTRFLAGAHA